MGSGTALQRFSLTTVLLLCAVITLAVTACPVRQQQSPPPQHSGLSAQRIADFTADPDWPAEGSVVAYA